MHSFVAFEPIDCLLLIFVADMKYCSVILLLLKMVWITIENSSNFILI